MSLNGDVGAHHPEDPTEVEEMVIPSDRDGDI